MQVGRDLQQFMNIPEGPYPLRQDRQRLPGGGLPCRWQLHRVMAAGDGHPGTALHVLRLRYDGAHGQSDEPPGESFSIPDFARTTCHAMKALNIPKAHFIGNLAGASLSIEMAASYPERVDKLVLAPPPVVDPRMTARRMSGVDSLWDENGLALPRDAEHMTSNGGFVNPKAGMDRPA